MSGEFNSFKKVYHLKRVKRRELEIEFKNAEEPLLGIQVGHTRSLSSSNRLIRRRKMELIRFLQVIGIFLLLIFLNTCAWVTEKKAYGESCSSPDECNDKELLSCQHDICNCFPSQSMIHDEVLQRCAARVGEKCGISNRVATESSGTIECVDGAICDDSSGGYCFCTDEYFRISNGTCVRKRRYMETCKNDNECSKDIRNSRPMSCTNGYCTCDKKYQYYDNERKQCVTKVGMECSMEVSVYRNECTDKAVCSDSRCVCGETFAPNNDGRCGRGFNQSCSGDNLCSNIQYTCLEGFCQCKYPLHQLFDPKSKECVSLVGGPCTLLNLNKSSSEIPFIQRCTRNGVCIDQGFYAACECRDGYVQRKNGECAPGYGESCEPSECSESDLPNSRLYCKNGKCDCQDQLQYYDPNRKRCLGLVGSRCNPMEFNQCVQFASCIQIGTKLEGKCLCDRYSTEVANRTCIYTDY